MTDPRDPDQEHSGMLLDNFMPVHRCKIYVFLSDWVTSFQDDLLAQRIVPHTVLYM